MKEVYRKTYKVHPFGDIIEIIVGQSFKSMCNKFDLPIEEEYFNSHGLTASNGDRLVILIPADSFEKYGTIAHECNHALNVIFKYRGVQLDLENDEMQSHLLGWLVDRVHKTIESYRKKLDK